MERKFLNNLLVALLLFLLISSLFSLFSPPTGQKQLTVSELVQAVNEQRVEKITAIESRLEIRMKDGSTLHSRKEAGTTLAEMLTSYGADPAKVAKLNLEIKTEQNIWVWLGPVLLFLAPFLVLGFILWLMFQQAKSGAMRAFDFTRARARLFGAGGAGLKERVTFEDVAGLQEAKEELKEVVDFLKNPQKYLKMGAKIPRGILLVGPPGSGKTLLARAISGEANVPFFSIAGSEFIELFVGTGAARTRDLFATAKKAGRAIIFIDEIDAVGRTRAIGVGGVHEEREQTLNQILVEMDGFERDDGRIVIAATNRGDVLDPALLRPGRFDRRIVLDLPDAKEREQILKLHSKDKPLDREVDLKEVAERTPGFSGADLANLVNEAALLAARRNKNVVSQKEYLESIEKVLLGPERKSHILSKKEKEIAAFHEAGHALVGSLLPGAEPVRKISIVSRGMAAGYTLRTPIEERKLKNKAEFLDELAMTLGGYVAEEIVFGQVTTGAANDLHKASNLARRLVKDYGMSDLGPIAFGEKEGLMIWPHDFSESRNYSEKVAAKIDKEVERLIKQAKEKANVVLKKNRKLLEKVAKTLIEKETIEREEFEKLISPGYDPGIRSRDRIPGSL